MKKSIVTHDPMQPIKKKYTKNVASIPAQIGVQITDTSNFFSLAATYIP